MTISRRAQGVGGPKGSSVGTGTWWAACQPNNGYRHLLDTRIRMPLFVSSVSTAWKGHHLSSPRRSVSPTPASTMSRMVSSFTSSHLNSPDSLHPFKSHHTFLDHVSLQHPHTFLNSAPSCCLNQTHPSVLDTKPQTTEVRCITPASQLTEKWLLEDKGPRASWQPPVSFILQLGHEDQVSQLRLSPVTSLSPTPLPITQL